MIMMMKRRAITITSPAPRKSCVVVWKARRKMIAKMNTIALIAVTALHLAHAAFMVPSPLPSFSSSTTRTRIFYFNSNNNNNNNGRTTTTTRRRRHLHERERRFPPSSIRRRDSRLFSISNSSVQEVGPRLNIGGGGDGGRGARQTEQMKRIEFQVYESIANISASDWDACLTDDDDNDNQASPFLEHAWLHCLEVSRCASQETGWVPRHVSISLDGGIVGYVPLYIRYNSAGEFIFDQAWAEAAYQNGIPYYPKLLVAVPFTPATGRRILWKPDIRRHYSKEDMDVLYRAVGQFLRQVADKNRLSGVHINFLTNEEATTLAGALEEIVMMDNGGSGAGNDDSRCEEMRKSSTEAVLLDNGLHRKDDYLRRTSVQYHWKNQHPDRRDSHGNMQAYSSFDDYLSCFRSKRRITIRRERCRVLQDKGIRIDAVRGKDILKVVGLVERMFEIYRSTIDKMFFGRQYLTLDFFKRLSESSFVENLCFMCARYNHTGDTLRAEDVFAGTFNIVKNGVYYGRYWGCLAEDEIKNLHFETCYWSAIEYCIKEGLQRMEPGAGGGDYKWARGFDAAVIHSVHYISHPGLRRAIGQFIKYETEDNAEFLWDLQKRRKRQGA